MTYDMLYIIHVWHTLYVVRCTLYIYMYFIRWIHYLLAYRWASSTTIQTQEGSEGRSNNTTYSILLTLFMHTETTTSKPYFCTYCYDASYLMCWLGDDKFRFADLWYNLVRRINYFFNDERPIRIAIITVAHARYATTCGLLTLGG